MKSKHLLVLFGLMYAEVSISQQSAIVPVKGNVQFSIALFPDRSHLGWTAYDTSDLYKHLVLKITNNTDSTIRFYNPDDPSGPQTLQIELLFKDSLYKMAWQGRYSEKRWPGTRAILPTDSFSFSVTLRPCTAHLNYCFQGLLGIGNGLTGLDGAQLRARYIIPDMNSLPIETPETERSGPRWKRSLLREAVSEFIPFPAEAWHWLVQTPKARK